MPSDKHSLITAKAMGLIFSLFGAALAQQVPYGIPQYVQCKRHGLTFAPPLCPISFADSPRCQLAIVQWLPYVHKWEFPIFFVVTGLIAEALLLLFFVCNIVKWAKHS